MYSALGNHAVARQRHFAVLAVGVLLAAVCVVVLTLVDEFARDRRPASPWDNMLHHPQFSFESFCARRVQLWGSTDIARPDVSQPVTDGFRSHVHHYVEYMNGRLCRAVAARRAGDYEHGDRYVIVKRRQTTGTGNRILSVASAFLAAVVTDRILILDWPKMPEAFDEPLSQWELGVAWRQGLYLDRVDMTYYSVRSHDAGSEDCVWCHHATCSNLTTLLANTTTVQLDASMYWAPLLFMNPFHREYLEGLFGAHSVFPTLLQELLHPSYAVRSAVYDAGLDPDVGLQIRAFAGPNPAQTQAFTGCGGVHADKNDSVFVASMYEGVRRTVSEELQGTVVWYGEAQGRQRGNVGQLQAAAVDMLLLSRADTLVTSGMSTFGYVAAAWGSEERKQFRVPRRTLQCEPLSSLEPCFHQWGSTRPRYPHWPHQLLHSPHLSCSSDALQELPPRLVSGVC